MGHRHQLFVIARVQGRYRSVAAFDSQWLRGTMTVEAAGRLVRAFINPFNAAAIASELATLERLDLDALSHEGIDGYDNPDILCPYLAGVFMTSFRVDMVEGQVGRLSMIPHNVLRCENNDGYTYFDLSEQGKPRYCFSWDNGPLNALQYLGIYYGTKDSGIDPTILDLLGHCPLVNLSALTEAQPNNRSFKRAANGTTGGFPSSATVPPASPPVLPDIRSAIRKMLSTDHTLGTRSIISTLEGFATTPGYLEVLRLELMAVKVLNGNGLFLMKHLLSTERARFVDLTPWLSTGALDAASLLDLSCALQSAEYLDLSSSHALTADSLEALVSRLPMLRHVVALCCAHLSQLSTALPLTTCLTSLSLLDAVNQTRFNDGGLISAPQCVRWAEESDAPAGLSILLFCRPFNWWPHHPNKRQRFGVELGQFGAEGIIRGFTLFVKNLLRPRDLVDEHEFYFEMRAFFHGTGAVPVSECIAASSDATPCYAYGTLPSLIRDISDKRGRTYGEMHFSESAAASDDVTRVPRHPGWVLVLNLKKTRPFRKINHKSASRRNYAFERWDFHQGRKLMALRPVERISVREWVRRLPAGHGPVPEAVVADCEAALARLNVAVRGKPKVRQM